MPQGVEFMQVQEKQTIVQNLPNFLCINGFNYFLIKQLIIFIILSNANKDTHREKVPSNKTPVLKKSMNMDIWVIGT